MKTPETLREELRRARNDKEARLKGVVIKDYDLYRRDERQDIILTLLAVLLYLFMGVLLGLTAGGVL